MNTSDHEKNKYMFLELLREGYNFAAQCERFLLMNEPITSLIYLLQAHSYVNGAKIYKYSDERFDRSEYESYFHRFEVFSKEVGNCIQENHSPRWANIEFERFEEVYQNVKVFIGE